VLNRYCHCLKWTKVPPHAPYGCPFVIFTNNLVTMEDFNLKYLHKIFIKWKKQALYLLAHVVEDPKNLNSSYNSNFLSTICAMSF
jgi:hypothetical protein